MILAFICTASIEVLILLMVNLNSCIWYYRKLFLEGERPPVISMAPKAVINTDRKREIYECDVKGATRIERG